jgi:hypothetical protein
VQVAQDSSKVRVEPILTSTQVYRANWKAVANPSNVIECETINPIRVAVTMCTGQIAVIGQTKPDRKTTGHRISARLHQMILRH